MTTLGKRIRVVRGRRSQTVFANFLGISKGALANYEHDRSSPNAKILMTICLLEHIEIKWLLTGEGPRYQGEWKTSLMTFLLVTMMDHLSSYRDVHTACGWKSSLIKWKKTDVIFYLKTKNSLLIILSYITIYIIIDFYFANTKVMYI